MTRLYGDSRPTSEQWIATLPRHWSLVPAKALFAERREGSRSSDVHLTPSQQYGVLPQDEYMAITGNKVVLNLEGADNMKHVEPRDFVIHLRSFQGGIEYSRHRGKVSMAYTVLRPRSDLDDSFFRWMLKSNGYVQELRTTTNQLRDGQSIKFSQFASVPLPVPPLAEQRAIADYLDAETAKIDALITKQQQLIATLRERRAAAAASDATKGTSTPATLKPSGLDWAGEIPAHWRVARLRDVARMESGHTPSRTREDLWENCYIPWVSLNDTRALTTNEYIYETSNLISDAGIANSSARLLPAGTVVLSRDATIGRSSIIGVPMATSQHFAAWVCGPNLLPRYLWLLFTSAMQTHFNSLTDGATLRTIGMPDLRAFAIPLPPVEEQLAICEYAAAQTAKADALIAKTERFIELSRERRAALITAAVTGQIDVQEVPR